MNNEVTKLKKESFGNTAKGEEASLYIMTNKNGMQLAVSDYGATLVSLFVPDRNNELVDVVLGFGDVRDYEMGGKNFYGATIGRNANRIGHARFSLNGKAYQLENNNNGSNLHSGFHYYNQRMWQVRSKSETSITLTLHSPNGDQGYPGALDMEVTYTVTKDNGIQIEYFSTPNEDTVINMTNHSYFNLNGHDWGTILDQGVWIDASYYTRTDSQLIPTGELVEVEGTPMDFNEMKLLGRDIDLPYEALDFGQGYDQNWALNNCGMFSKVAEMQADHRGILMEVYTDRPGMQLYTGNFLDGTDVGKENVVYQRRSGVCFETQFFPDAVNQEHFKGPICKAGDVYRTKTMYKFMVV